MRTALMMPRSRRSSRSLAQAPDALRLDPDAFEAWTYRLVVRFCLRESRRSKRTGVRDDPWSTSRYLSARTPPTVRSTVRDQLARQPCRRSQSSIGRSSCSTTIRACPGRHRRDRRCPVWHRPIAAPSRDRGTPGPPSMPASEPPRSGGRSHRPRQSTSIACSARSSRPVGRRRSRPTSSRRLTGHAPVARGLRCRRDRVAAWPVVRDVCRAVLRTPRHRTRRRVSAMRPRSVSASRSPGAGVLMALPAAATIRHLPRPVTVGIAFRGRPSQRLGRTRRSRSQGDMARERLRDRVPRERRRPRESHDRLSGHRLAVDNFAPGAAFASSTDQVAPDQIRLALDVDSPACPAGAEGLYRTTLSPDGLLLTLATVSDACQTRRFDALGPDVSAQLARRRHVIRGAGVSSHDARRPVHAPTLAGRCRGRRDTESAARR